MATDKTRKHNKQWDSGARVAAIEGIFNIINTGIERFGWIGFLVAFGCAFIVIYASDIQKRQLVDMYILGKGTPYSVVVVGGLCLAVLFAQKYVYDKEAAELEKSRKSLETERDRLASQVMEANRRLEVIERDLKPAQKRRETR